MTMKLATSYFGNRIPRHVREDMQQLRGLGFQRVIHTFTENDLAYYRATLREIVQVTENCGLDAWLDPWGVARIFGGEAYSHWIVENEDLCQRGASGRRLGGACLNHPRLRELLRSWIDAAAETGAHGVFWDEPHWAPRGPANPDGEICVCEHCRRLAGERLLASPQEADRFRGESVVHLLGELTAHAAQRGLASSLCLLPAGLIDQPPVPWNKLAGLPGVVEFGTDPYWQAFGIQSADERDRFIDTHSSAAISACRAAGVACLLWVQAFRVPASREADLLEGTRRLIAHAPETIAIWGFEACAHMSELACEQPLSLWRKLIDQLRPDLAGGRIPRERPEDTS